MSIARYTWLALIFLTLTANTQAQPIEPKAPAPLFPEQGFAGWIFDHNPADLAVPAQITSDSGIIRIPGKPHGALLTQDTFGQYILSYQWRWPEQAGNSGVLIHASGSKVQWGWPKCLEPQLQAGNAGDLFSIGSFRFRPAGKEESQTGGSATNWSDNAERETGQWNTMHIVCERKTIEVYVNGTLINRAFDLETNHGKLGFQCEAGKPIEIRHATLGPVVLKPTEAIDLLAGDLEQNWSLGAVEPKAFANAASLKDGVLTLSPDSPSPLRTVQRYKDYELSLNFRWPKEKSQAVLLLHSHTPVSGRDFIDPIQLNLQDTATNPADQWNKLVVRSTDDALTITVNGREAYSATSLKLTSGMIGLHLSDTPLEIGHAVIKPIDAD